MHASPLIVSRFIQAGYRANGGRATVLRSLAPAQRRFALPPTSPAQLSGRRARLAPHADQNLDQRAESRRASTSAARRATDPEPATRPPLQPLDPLAPRHRRLRSRRTRDRRRPARGPRRGSQLRRPRANNPPRTPISAPRREPCRHAEQATPALSSARLGPSSERRDGRADAGSYGRPRPPKGAMRRRAPLCARSQETKWKKPESRAGAVSRASLGKIPAASYSPTRLPVQYHRLRRA